jgi:hypothetical protein
MRWWSNPTIRRPCFSRKSEVATSQNNQHCVEVQNVMTERRRWWYEKSVAEHEAAIEKTKLSSRGQTCLLLFVWDNFGLAIIV